MEERRAYIRRLVNLRAELRIDDQVREAKTKDLSMGGMRIATDTSLSVGQELTVDLFLVNEVKPDEMIGPLHVDGTIVWIKDLPAAGQIEAGVRFGEVSAIQAQWLERYITEINDVA